jgi:hypothetical protein
MQMFGEHNGKKYQSPQLKLENSANNFERAQVQRTPPPHTHRPAACNPLLHGKALAMQRTPQLMLCGSGTLGAPGCVSQTDVFEVEAAVGEVKSIRIGHDNSVRPTACTPP